LILAEKSQLEVEGVDFSVEGLNLQDINYQKPSQVEDAIRSIREAIEQVREYGTKLSNDFSIIGARQDFTNNIINTLNAGASDLTDADLNEEGANLLAAQTRVELSTVALSLAGQSNASLLQIFTGGGAGSVLG
jgi:flagellin-like hook-associated protein FlgL